MNRRNIRQLLLDGIGTLLPSGHQDNDVQNENFPGQSLNSGNQNSRNRSNEENSFHPQDPADLFSFFLSSLSRGQGANNSFNRPSSNSNTSNKRRPATNHSKFDDSDDEELQEAIRLSIISHNAEKKLKKDEKCYLDSDNKHKETNQKAAEIRRVVSNKELLSKILRKLPGVNPNHPIFREFYK